MTKKPVDECLKLDHRSFAETLEVTGEEKTDDEIILNNIKNYMKIKKYSEIEIQNFKDKYFLYLKYEQLIDRIVSFYSKAILASYTSIFILSLEDKKSVNALIETIIAAVLILGVHIYKNRHGNPYEEDLADYEDVLAYEEKCKVAVKHAK